MQKEALYFYFVKLCTYIYYILRFSLLYGRPARSMILIIVFVLVTSLSILELFIQSEKEMHRI